MLGIVLGFVLGAKSVRDQLALDERRAAEREARRAARTAAQDAAGDKKNAGGT